MSDVPYITGTMFVRKLKRKTTQNIAVQIVRNDRTKDGKVRQKIVRHMGTAPEGPAFEALLHIAEQERLRIEERVQPTLFPSEHSAHAVLEARHRKQSEQPIPLADIRKLEEVKRVCVGFHEVFGALYARMGLDRLFSTRHAMAARLFRQAVLLRLAAPGDSKLAHARQLSKEDGVEVPVHKFYRMMDAVDDRRIARLQSMVAREVTDLLGGKLDVLFFDVTTLSFASDKPDELRKKGYSKDGKHNRVQVVLALMQTRDGLPVGYELFEGNTADVKTLEPAIASLKARFALDRVVFVADAGMLSADNVALLHSMGHDYVVAARLRSMKAEELRKVTGTLTWQATSDGRKVTEVSIGDRRLILRYCPKRAAKDAHEREQAIKKARKRLASGVKGSGRNGRYLKVKRGAVKLNAAAIERDRQLEGLHGVWTSLKASSGQEVYAQYGGLWQIEEGFRVLKHTLAIRPVFHWTERRVRAHIAICFAAFAMLRILRRIYNTRHGAEAPISEGQILAQLREVEVSVVRDNTTKRHFAIPSAANSTKVRLYKELGLTIQRQTVPVEKDP